MKQWYVITYDIRVNKRLRRTHYVLKKEGLHLQKSVFLLHKTPQQLNKLLHKVGACVNSQEDDVRLYPLRHPNAMWMAGQQQETMLTLFPAEAIAPPESMSWFKKITHLFKKD